MQRPWMLPQDRNPKGTVLTPIEEVMIVGFRRRTLHPLDYVFGCLKVGIPKLTRSSLHRCLVRHGISRLPGTRSERLQTLSVRRQDDRLRPGRYLRPSATTSAASRLRFFLRLSLIVSLRGFIVRSTLSIPLVNGQLRIERVARETLEGLPAASCKVHWQPS